MVPEASRSAARTSLCQGQKVLWKLQCVFIPSGESDQRCKLFFPIESLKQLSRAIPLPITFSGTHSAGDRISALRVIHQSKIPRSLQFPQGPLFLWSYHPLPAVTHSCLWRGRSEEVAFPEGFCLWNIQKASFWQAHSKLHRGLLQNMKTEFQPNCLFVFACMVFRFIPNDTTSLRGTDMAKLPELFEYGPAV